MGSPAIPGSTRSDVLGKEWTVEAQWLGAWQRENRADNSFVSFSLPEPVEAAGRETALEAGSPSGVTVANRKRAA